MRESWPRSDEAPGWREIGEFVYSVLADFGTVAISIAVVSMLIARTTTIIGEVLMTLYQAMVNLFVIPVIERHKAQGRVEGRAENQAEWQAWYDRRVKAERDGRDFDEPPPGA